MAAVTKEAEQGIDVRSPCAKDNIVASTEETRDVDKPTSMDVSQIEEGMGKIAEETWDEVLKGGKGD